MQFGYNESGFPGEDRAAALADVAAAGYDGAELHLDSALGDPAALGGLADALEEHGLAVPAAMAAELGPQLSSTDPAVREQGVALGEQLIGAAETLGAEAALIVPGQVDAATPYDVAYENALDSVSKLAGLAADRGVTLAVENVWNDMLYSPREFAEFVDAAAESGPVGAYLDVGNVRRWGHPQHWVRILGDRIVRVHVKDYDTDAGTLAGFTYPLQGDVDWNAVAEELDAVGYDGWVTAEVPPYPTRPERTPNGVLGDLRAVF
jgi:hexulose-6-phosphate isomerase